MASDCLPCVRHPRQEWFYQAVPDYGYAAQLLRMKYARSSGKFPVWMICFFQPLLCHFCSGMFRAVAGFKHRDSQFKQAGSLTFLAGEQAKLPQIEAGFGKGDACLTCQGGGDAP
jgi:hypothetical protein